MAKDRKIFVGSSSEALGHAKLVAQVIKEADMEAVVWNRDAFVVGKTLLETIESLPFDYHGAVLLATPDVSYTRNGAAISAPVANVVFEYGYLAARLTRDRVAICRFNKAELPSDLAGMKLVEVENYGQESQPALPPDRVEELASWLQQLPKGVSGIPAISQVHGYSGTWNVESNFLLWRGVPVEGENKVFWEGKTFLVLQADGESGSGVQVGNLYIAIDEYRARYEVVNEILSASVDKGGNLKVRVRVARREGPKDESGTLSDPRLRQPLMRKDFDISLNASSTDESRKLVGTHEYRSATTIYQKAEERWEYSGLFGPCCL